jgi:serine phosphatase RsbU (regulator of sigma subunit)
MILDIPDHEHKLEMIGCGHPPPLLLRDGHVTSLDAAQHPPLGLGELAPPHYDVDTFPFEAGDLLLLYTDGVIEARNTAGDFYPLLERVTGWTDSRPDAFLQRLRGDLLAHTGGRLNDDAALIAVQRMPTP